MTYSETDVYPHVPGHRDVVTSIEAADAIAPVTARIQRMALARIKAAGARGYTAAELADVLAMERTTVQPRTTELRRLGLIDDSGQRRPNPNGKRAIVWIATGVGA